MRPKVIRVALLLWPWVTLAASSATSCRAAGLCCQGKNKQCVGVRLAGHTETTKACFCDAACLDVGDCCQDFRDFCNETVYSHEQPVHAYEGGFTRPLIGWLQRKPIRTSPRGSDTPLWSLVHQVVWKMHGPRYYFNAPDRLQPRDHGALVWLEKSDVFQRWNRWCIDQNPDSYSLLGFACTVIVDYGISSFVQAKKVQDLLVCALSGKLTGDVSVCLGWLLWRYFVPGHLPKPFELEKHFQKHRNIQNERIKLQY